MSAACRRLHGAWLRRRLLWARLDRATCYLEGRAARNQAACPAERRMVRLLVALELPQLSLRVRSLRERLLANAGSPA